MSASTWPGPTEGSWSTSPTMSSAAASGTARNSERINRTSTMLASSTTRRSQSRECSSVRRNSPVRGSVSNRRWMVFASSPVLSDSRLAALPVGAQSATRTCLAIRIFRIELTRVVLPTPGPPVITSTLLERAIRTASRWLAASCRPVRRSTQGNRLGTVDRRPGWSGRRALTRSTQNPFSGLWNVTRSTRPAKASVAVVWAIFATLSALRQNRIRCGPLTSDMTDQ